MFYALAIVCDEYFMGAIDVIVERWEISYDVAAATFQAAGGSGPELATSFVGTFIAKSNVGFGTIVGSAVFNVLFVIGVCAYNCPAEGLPLDWYPLTRDCTFYVLDLLLLAGFFYDQKIQWWESGALILM